MERVGIEKLSFDYDLKEVLERYKKIYVGAVYDALENLGYPNNALCRKINPLVPDMQVAGPAFTIKEHRNPTRDLKDLDRQFQLLKFIYPGCVQIRDTGNDKSAAHFGLMSSIAAMSRGCVGAVIDGCLRDAKYLIDKGFPTFVKYTIPVEAFHRITIDEVQVPIYVNGALGPVIVNPGDYIFGDIDGVVIIPKELTLKVLEEAEKIAENEKHIREDLSKKGSDPFEVYKKYGRY